MQRPKSHSAGGIIIGPNGRILVVENKGTTWSIPKGRVEKGEEPLTTARREIKEETGITRLKTLGLLGTYTRFRMGAGGVELKDHLMRFTVFLFYTPETHAIARDADITKLAWMKPSDAIKRITHSVDRDFLEKRFLPMLEKPKPVSRVRRAPRRKRVMRKR